VYNGAGKLAPAPCNFTPPPADLVPPPPHDDNPSARINVNIASELREFMMQILFSIRLELLMLGARLWANLISCSDVKCPTRELQKLHRLLVLWLFSRAVRRSVCKDCARSYAVRAVHNKFT